MLKDKRISLIKKKWASSTATTTIHYIVLLTIFLAPTINGFRPIEITNSEGRKLFGGYRITPKTCRATKTLPRSDPRSEGTTICMFNHECAQRNGEVVGACMDGFLFGACCQLPPGVNMNELDSIDNSYGPSQTNSAAVAAAQSYESYGASGEYQDKYNDLRPDPPNLPNTNFYGNQQELEAESSYQGNIHASQLNTLHEEQNIKQSAPIVSSTTTAAPKPIPVEIYNDVAPVEYISSTSTTTSTTTHRPNFVKLDIDGITYTTELPSRYSTYEIDSSIEEDKTVSTSLPDLFEETSLEHDQYKPSNSHSQISFLGNGEFSHSDITHPGADSELLENDLQFSTGYGPEPVYVPSPIHSTQIPSKPIFRPKPLSTTTKQPSTTTSTYKTTSSDENYVLVQTITNGPPKPLKSPTEPSVASSGITTNMDSIESIILMLNGTNHGPSYDINNETYEENYYDSTDGGFYITTDSPAEKIASSTIPPTTTIKMSSARPIIINHSNPLPVYKPQSTTKRPVTPSADSTVSAIYTISNSFNGGVSTSMKPVTIVKKPTESVSYNPAGYFVTTSRPIMISSTKMPFPSPTASSTTTKVTKKPKPHRPATKQPAFNHPASPSLNGYQDEVIIGPPKLITKRPATSNRPVSPPSFSGYHDDVSNKPSSNHPASSYYDENNYSSHKQPTSNHPASQSLPTTNGYHKPTSNHPASQSLPSTNGYQNEVSYKPVTQQPSSNGYHDEIIISPTKKIVTRRPPSQAPSTSYVTGPTTPRPTTPRPTVSSTTTISDKIDYSQDTSDKVSYAQQSLTSSYGQQSLTTHHQTSTTHKKPVFVPIQTQKPPTPTIHITPKPTVTHLGSSTQSTLWVKQHTQKPRPKPKPANKPTTTKAPTSIHSLPNFASTSYIFSPLVTRRPDHSSTEQNKPLPPHTILQNEYQSPDYYTDTYQSQTPEEPYVPAIQISTDSLHVVPGDHRPSFPGYYGSTPSYPLFHVPTAVSEKNENDEETHTSPNDSVNFPPVRNPNLNTSVPQSSVTTDFEVVTPAFVEDTILKNKMNTLVYKIVESLQDRFDALSDLIDDGNATAHFHQAVPDTTRRPGTTKRPVVRRTTTRPPAKKSQTTKRPVATRKPANTKAPPTSTRKPTRKPTKKLTTTTSASFEDELDEEDNEIDNEISENSANVRKFQCGTRPQVKSGRIVGGKGAAFGAFPWQVLVRESTWLGLFTKNKCGGVLISNNFVVTAAHCQPGFLASLVAVFGEFDISGDLEPKRSTTKNVKRVIVHRQYDAATFENDLALLELESPIHFDSHIVPICMPTDNADFTGRMATVTGWGRLKYGGGVPSVLQEVQVPIIENSVCQEMFHTAGHNKKILNSFLCAGYANGQKDSCEGDSGGPLVLQRHDGRWELAGTVSHGIKCAAPYLPGVYMRTTFYKPWLKSITGIK
ncbi:TMPRSS11D family protein [Megaselia abdita]